MKKKSVIRNLGWKKGVSLKSCKGSDKGQGAANVPNGQERSKVVVPNSKTNAKKRNSKHSESYEDERDLDYEASSNSHSDDFDEDDGDEEQSSSEVLKGMLLHFLQRDSKKRKSKDTDTGSMKIRKEEWRSQGHRRSEGHRVCARGEVIRTHFENVGKQPNIVCRVESFCLAVQKFDDDRRQLVRRMGFEGLLGLDMKNIPRQFCYWLMTRVGGDGTVVFGDGVMLPLGAKQVRYILGIPMGANPVPTHVDMECEEDLQKVNRIIELYGVGSKKETISLAAASRVMCPLDESGEILPLGDDEQDQEDFMTAFMVVVLGKLICTTTNSSNMARALVPAVTVASRAIDFDWCSFTFSWLCDTAARFQKKFLKDGYRSGCGGCPVFLLIYYLDHLQRAPVQWGVYPRIKVWTSEEIRAAVAEDRLTRDNYGKLMPIDIAYNGEPHPMIPREDEGCSEQDDVVDKVLTRLAPRLITLVEGIVGKAMGAFGGVVGGGGGSYVSDGAVGNRNNEANTATNGSLFKGLPKDVLTAAQADQPNDGDCSKKGGVEDLVPKSKAVDGVERSRQTPFDKALLAFVRAWKEVKDENYPGPTIIECDGMDATQRDCYRLIGGRARLGDQYVRMASVLYTKEWSEIEFPLPGKRILLDPTYATRLMQKKKDYADLAKIHGKAFCSHALDDIRVVFMPVLDLSVKDADHWWCLAVDFASKEIWMIDSLVKDPFEAHTDIVTELVQGLDVLAGSNPQWVLDQMCNWPHRVMEMAQQTDTYSCGVLMLSCIKHCAVTFDTPHVLEKSLNVRTKIFLEDLHSKFNSMKANLEGLISEDRRGAGKRNGSVTTQ